MRHRSRDIVECPPGPDGIELLQAWLEQHVYDRHIHESYAIGVTLRGVQRFWCRGATRDSLPGQVMVIRPGEVHDGRSGAPGGYAYRMLYIRPDVLDSCLAEATGRMPELDAAGPTLCDARAAACLDAAWKALADAPASLAGDELLLRGINLLQSRGLRGATPPAAPRNQQALERVREYLHARLDQHVTTTELAAVASMSRFQLSRQFQAHYGLPLHGYHLHLRLEEAKRRLRNGQPVAAVAVDLGFADQSHFHRRFRGSFGITPGAWRTAHGYKTAADARATVDATYGAARGTHQAFRGARRDP